MNTTTHPTAAPEAFEALRRLDAPYPRIARREQEAIALCPSPGVSLKE